MPFKGADNWVFRILNRMVDLVALNFCWMLCSLPIFTIGASLTALYDINLKIWNKKEGYIIRGFFKSFKENFKKATLVWLLFLLTAVVLYCDYYYWNYIAVNVSVGLYMAMMALTLFLAIAAVGMFLYIFPLLAYFDNSISGMLKNSFLLAVRHLPTTLLMLVIPIGCIGTIFLTVYASLFFFCLGIALICYLNAYFVGLVFKKYSDGESEDTAQI